MASQTINKPNCTVFIPTFKDQYTTDVSVLVLFPGIPVGGKTGKTYFPPMIKAGAPTWFDKYVIVIPNEHTSKWDSVKKEYTEAMAATPQGTGKDPNYVLKEKTVSIGVFSGSGNGNVSIQANLVSIKPTHLIIMDPSASGPLTQNVKTLVNKGTSCYLMYNPNNWDSYPALKNGFPALAAAVDAGGNKSQKVKLGHTSIPPQTLKTFAPDIEKKLITPTQKPEEQPPVVEEKKTDEQVAADANQDAAGKTQSTSPKWNITIDGLGDAAVGAAPVAYEISAKKDLPGFTIYVGNPQTDWARFGETIPEGGENFEDVAEDEEFVEGGFAGAEEMETEFEAMEEAPSAERAAEAASVVEQLENSEPVNVGNHKLDLIPGTFVTNGGTKIQCCQINGAPVNVKIAGAWLDMVAAAKKDGVTLSIGSGFRSPYDSINTKSASGVKVSASSQQSLYDAYLAGRGNLAAKPGNSNHGNGIGVDTNAGGKSKGRFINVNQKVYTWLVKNSWRYGFVRAVKNEEWHFDYLPDLAKKGPYGRIAGTDANKFYSDWGLDKLTIA